MGQRLIVHQLVKHRHWYGPQIAAQIRDDDPNRQEKLAFALKHIPKPLDVQHDRSPERHDPEDPHVRWPENISALEKSSCASPLPGDRSQDAIEH